MELKNLAQKPLVIDFKNQGKLPPLYAQREDKESWGVKLKILDGGNEIDTSGIAVKFYAWPSHNVFELYERTFTEIDILKGEYELLYPTAILKGGLVRCKIKLYKDDATLSTTTINLFVEGTMVSDNAIETSDDYPIFEKLLMVNENEISRQQAEVLREALYERMAILQTELASLESQLNADENLRELAEIERNQAEILRNQLKQELETLKIQLTDLGQSTEFSLLSMNAKLVEVGNKLTEMTNLISSLSNAEALRVTAELNRSEKETLRQQAETTRAGFYDGFNASLNDMTQDFNAQLAKVDSEVILARGGFGTLKQRLDSSDARVADLESRAIRQYGARRTLNATSPLLERIFDAAGKSANVPTDDGAAVNDFDNIFPWSHIRECKRDATGRIHYKGDPGYDLLTNVDWLIEIPKFYIRMQRTATTFDRVISEIKRAGFWVPSVYKRADGTECDKIYVGRFKTGIVDGVDVSRPGIFPENFRDLASFRTGARAKGAGWQLIDISYKTEVLDMLYIIESATLNSQVYLGNGITTVRYVATDVAQIAETAVNRIVVTNAMAVNYNVGENICIGAVQGSENIARDRTILSKAPLPDGINTEIVFDGNPVNIAVGNVLWQGAQKNGQTINLQKPNGKLSGVSGRTSNKYRGMEDIFGNVFEWVDGVLISERIAQICKDPAKYASTLTADYKPVGYTNLATDGYPLEMGFDSNFPEAIFPTTPGGGTTTGYCDYYYQATGLRGACFGGHAGNGVFAGVFYWGLNGAPANSGWLIGSRLLFKPPV